MITPWQQRVKPGDSAADIENHMLEEIEELRAAIPQQVSEPAPQWLPIETAPKDGTEILLGGPDCSMTFGFYSNGWHSDADGAEEWATHWAPRPSAPPPNQRSGNETTD